MKYMIYVIKDKKIIKFDELNDLEKQRLINKLNRKALNSAGYFEGDKIAKSGTVY